ncbi:ATP synthase F1 subunit gamma [Mesoaciditoga lauensis]|uniref:ATP synthase F1 subunit gamma n=1 Tax=Mesoaciditoga lauensis TaxID=1495039 RepID=UPI00056D308D|nr:ATP synthase F1 subunit gamma [Mesoaciditoga lauensis]
MGRGTEQLIKKKIKSVSSTMHITRAMEMVATAKLNKLQRMVKNFYDYEKNFSDIFARVVGATTDFNSPLLYKEEPKKTLVVVFSGDMGLCGAYNNDVIDFSYKIAEDLKEKFAGFYVVGARAKSRMAFDKKKVRYSITNVYGTPSYDDAQSFANELANIYLNEEDVDSIKIVQGYPKNPLIQLVKVEDFLPIKPVKASNNVNSVYDYEPEPTELLNAILPQYMGIKMFRIMIEARIAEQNARQNAMRNATENAKELVKDLTLKYNKARQAYITQEIIEVTNGSEALKDA